MTPYWLLFAVFALGALIEPDERRAQLHRLYLLQIAALGIALMIGLRFKVGADWNTYDLIFDFSQRVSAGRMVEVFREPAYALLTWGVSHAHGEIWHVNLVCGLIFAWGLQRFALAQPRPWLATAIAIPYLVIVVAMGYTRQAVAIGIIMAGLAAVMRGASTARFAAYIIAAALFHKTAVMVLPLVAFAQERNRFVNLLVGIALSFLFYDLFLSESVNYFYRNYILAEYSSQGAAIRCLLNAVPSVLYLLNRRNFQFSPIESKLWFYFAITSLLLLILLPIIPSSTAIDRMALYIIPIQMVIWPRVPMAYRLQGLGRLLLVSLSALVLFTWLNFALHSRYWVPYRVYPVFS